MYCKLHSITIKRTVQGIYIWVTSLLPFPLTFTAADYLLLVALGFLFFFKLENVEELKSSSINIDLR